MAAQTSITEQAEATAGLAADARVYDGGSRKTGVVESATDVMPGTVAFWVDESEDTVQPPPDFEAAAADADGLIATPVSTATSEVVIDGTEFDGAVGPGEHNYGYRVTIALNSHADWDDTEGVIKGKEADTGRVVEEKFDIPDSGNVTLTTVARFSRVDEIRIPGQSGTNGSVTAGYLAPERANVDKIAGLVLRNVSKEPDADGHVSYADEETLSAARRGSVYCEIEEDVTAGTRPWMRVTASASETKGALRASSDSGDAVELPSHFRFVKDGDFSVLALAPVEVNL